MKQPVFTGSGVAIVTPFTRDSVDFAAFRRLIDFQLENHTDAIIVCGTTGEASTMREPEKRRVIEFCVEYVAGRVPVIAGTGSNSTEQSVIHSRDAEQIGVDALLVVAPYYNKASQTGLVRHFSRIADAVSKPVILYNIPSRTGVNIQPETYARLSEHPNINGVKEASGDLNALQRTRNVCPEDFYIWSGEDTLTAPVCLLGGKGVISVAANIIPAKMHELVELCLHDQYETAGKLQVELMSLCDALFCDVNPIPIKTALHMLGYRGADAIESDDLRLPLCPPSPEKREIIRRVLIQYGLLQEC